jgi:hypothetical protein
MQLLLRLVRSQTRLEVLTPAQAREVSPVDPVLVDDGSALSRLLMERLGVKTESAAPGAGRDPLYVICDRLNRILRDAEVAKAWLPLRPGVARTGRLIEITATGGARLNRGAKSVRELAKAVASDAPGAASGVAQLAAHVLSLWLVERGEDPASDEGVAASIGLLRVADSAAEEPLD